MRSRRSDVAAEPQATHSILNSQPTIRPGFYLQLPGQTTCAPSGASSDRTLRDAVKLVLKATKLDTAILDATLRGKMIWPVSDILATRRVRIVFATGYDAFSLRRRYDGCQVVQKPILANAIVRMLTIEQFAAHAV